MIEEFQTTGYKCSDGKVFYHQNQAAVHEARDKLRSFATTEECGELQSVLEYRLEILTKFRDLLTDYLIDRE